MPRAAGDHGFFRCCAQGRGASSCVQDCRSLRGRPRTRGHLPNLNLANPGKRTRGCGGENLRTREVTAIPRVQYLRTRGYGEKHKGLSRNAISPRPRVEKFANPGMRRRNLRTRGRGARSRGPGFRSSEPGDVLEKLVNPGTRKGLTVVFFRTETGTHAHISDSRRPLQIRSLSTYSQLYSSEPKRAHAHSTRRVADPLTLHNSYRPWSPGTRYPSAPGVALRPRTPPPAPARPCPGRGASCG